MSSEYVQSTPTPSSAFLDLKLGYPSTSTIPIDVIRTATVSKLVNTQDPYFYLYGVTKGYDSCRKALASFLTKRYGQSVCYENLMITNGSSGGLDLLCRKLTQNGDVVITEDPTYFLVKEIFRDYKLNIVAAPMKLNFARKTHTNHAETQGERSCRGHEEDVGVDLVELEKLVIAHQPKLFYTIPIGHNPSGVTTPESIRTKVKQLAKKYNFTVVADEVYQLLAFSDTVPPPYAMTSDETDEGDHIVSLNSFSKILSPSLRLGWIQGSRRLISHLCQAGMLRSGGGLNPLVSGIAHEAIRLNLLGPAIDQTRQSLAEKATASLETLVKHFPDDVSWCTPEAGYFILVKLPKWLTGRQLLEECRQQKIGFLPGDEFGTDRFAHFIRLSFSFYESEDIRAGLKTIADVIQRMRPGA